jgi:uncharacterized phiE125 gp8 family phage protein
MSDVLTLDKAKRRLNLDADADDAEIQDLIDTAVEMLEGVTGGPAYTRTITAERVRSDDDRTLVLRRRPVVAVTAITSVWSGQPVDVTDLDIDSTAGIVRRRSGLPFLGYTNAYLVTYTAGWGDTSIPKAFETAALIVVAHMWEVQRGPTPGPTGWASEGMIPVPGYAYAVPNRALEILRPYTAEAYV